MFAVVTELTIRNVENSSMVDLRPIGVVRKKNKVGLWIDKIANQPGTSNAIDFDFFARDPFHKISGCELKKISGFFPIRLLIDDYSCSSVFDGNAGTVEDDDFIIACAS